MFRTHIVPVLLVSAGLGSGATLLWEPLPYFSEEDSPFLEGIRAGSIYLEDFEDHELNTPFIVTPSRGATIRSLNPNPGATVVWSVDGDDGVVDGDGFSGDTWSTFGILAGSIEFEFLPNATGHYPTYVGIVITRVDDYGRDVDMGFYDLNGSNVFSDAEFDPQTWSPPGGSFQGDPRLHRFVGVYHEEGIARIAMGNVRQVDHLQYGYAIPEPGTGLLVIVGFCGLLAHRRRGPLIGRA